MNNNTLLSRMTQVACDPKDYSKSFAKYLSDKTEISRELQEYLMSVYRFGDVSQLPEEYWYKPMLIQPLEINGVRKPDYDQMYITAIQFARAIAGLMEQDEAIEAEVEFVDSDYRISVKEFVECFENFSEINTNHVVYLPYKVECDDVRIECVEEDGHYKITIPADLCSNTTIEIYRREIPKVKFDVIESLSNLADINLDTTTLISMFELMGNKDSISIADLRDYIASHVGSKADDAMARCKSYVDICTDESMEVADRIKMLAEAILDDTKNIDEDDGSVIYDDTEFQTTFVASAYSGTSAASMWKSADCWGVAGKCLATAAKVLVAAAKVVVAVVKAVVGLFVRLWKKYIKPAYVSKDFVKSECDTTEKHCDVPLFMLGDEGEGVQFNSNTLSALVGQALTAESTIRQAFNPKVVFDDSSGELMVSVKGAENFAKAIEISDKSNPVESLTKFKITDGGYIYASGDDGSGPHDTITLIKITDASGREYSNYDHQNHDVSELVSPVFKTESGQVVMFNNTQLTWNTSGLVGTIYDGGGGVDPSFGGHAKLKLFAGLPTKLPSDIQSEILSRLGETRCLMCLAVSDKDGNVVAGVAFDTDGSQLNSSTYLPAIMEDGTNLADYASETFTWNMGQSVIGINVRWDITGDILEAFEQNNPNVMKLTKLVFGVSLNGKTNSFEISNTKQPTYVTLDGGEVSIGGSALAGVRARLINISCDTSMFAVPNFTITDNGVDAIDVLFSARNEGVLVYSTLSIGYNVSDGDVNTKHKITSINGTVETFSTLNKNWSIGYTSTICTVTITLRSNLDEGGYCIIRGTYASKARGWSTSPQYTYSSNTAYPGGEIRSEWDSKHTVLTWHSMPLSYVKGDIAQQLLQDVKNPVDEGCCLVLRYGFVNIQIINRNNVLRAMAYLCPVDSTKILDEEGNLRYVFDTTNGWFSKDGQEMNADTFVSSFLDDLRAALNYSSGYENEEGDLQAYKDLYASYELTNILFNAAINFGGDVSLAFSGRSLNKKEWIKSGEVNNKQFVDLIFTNTTDSGKATVITYALLSMVISNKTGYMRVYNLLFGQWPEFIPYKCGAPLSYPLWHISTDEDIQNYVDKVVNALVVAALIIAAAVVIGVAAFKLRKALRTKAMLAEQRVADTSWMMSDNANTIHHNELKINELTQQMAGADDATKATIQSSIKALTQQNSTLLSDSKNLATTLYKANRTATRWGKLCSLLGVTTFSGIGAATSAESSSVKTAFSKIREDGSVEYDDTLEQAINVVQRDLADTETALSAALATVNTNVQVGNDMSAADIARLSTNLTALSGILDIVKDKVLSKTPTVVNWGR